MNQSGNKRYLSSLLPVAAATTRLSSYYLPNGRGWHHQRVEGLGKQGIERDAVLNQSSESMVHNICGGLTDVLLDQLMKQPTRRRVGSTIKKHRNGGKNGLVSTEMQLSAAIRYFAGGRPDDIAISHGIAHSEVL
jgi:hypothetical protein